LRMKFPTMGTPFTHDPSTGERTMFGGELGIGFKSRINPSVVVLLPLVICLGACATHIYGEIVFEGGVSPEKPGDWGENVAAYVGLEGNTGSVSISGPNGYLTARETYIGYRDKGSLTLGDFSEFRTAELFVGGAAEGLVQISGGSRLYTGTTYVGWENNGEISVEFSQWDSGTVYVGYLASGSVVVDNSDLRVGKFYLSGGSLELSNPIAVEFGSFYGTLGDITGSGNVYARGAVIDTDLSFSSPVHLQQNFYLNDGNITFHLDLTSGEGDLGIGYRGSARLNIGGNVTVRAEDVYLGYLPESGGEAVVAGSDAKLHCSQLHVGYFGEGILTIHHGAEVAAWVSYVATTNQGRGTVLVTGPGSTWKTEYDLYLGGAGAKVTIADRAVATANWVIVPAGATLELEVTHDPVVILSRKPAFGGGVREATFSNEGTVILRAATNLPPGMYTPIVARVWDDRSGIYEAIGGVWDATRHVFAVGHAANENISVNWAESRQVPIYDVNTGSYVVVEFTGGGSGSGQLSGQPASGDVLQALQSVAGAPVAAAWLFDVTNYPTGSTAWLSFFVGPGYSHDLFRYWHWDGNQWSPFNPEESSYDGGYIQFKIPGFSGYGVSILPEPNALGILGSLAIGLAGYWWVRSRRRPNTAAAPSDHAG